MRIAHLAWILVGAAAISSTAHGRLAPRSLDSLLASSELIIEATPRQLTRKELGAGEATFSVLRVHRGSFSGTEITVRWGSEVHDQHVNDLDKDWLLFLKRDASGAYVAAEYGRSYWPFTSTVTEASKANLDHESRGFLLQYPLTLVELTAAQKKDLFASRAPPGVDSKLPYVAMNRLQALLKARPDAGVASAPALDRRALGVVTTPAPGISCFSGGALARDAEVLLFGDGDTAAGKVRSTGRTCPPEAGGHEVEGTLATRTVLEPSGGADQAIRIGVMARGEGVRVLGPGKVDLDGDGRAERFASCASSEGLHLTAWSGAVGKSARLWHAYVYLGYDTSPTCTEAESNP